jgi:glycosyltransferase involved in cell wall biosynthesis
MTLVIIANYWKNSEGGGVKTYLVNLVEALKSKGIEANVIFKEGEDVENYKIKGSRFLFPIRAFLILRKIKPEVIHSHGTWYCLLPGMVYKKLYGCRMIFTFHTEPVKDLPIIFKAFLTYLLFQCDYVTFVSKALKEKLEKVWRLRFGKTVITYPGVRTGEVSENDIKNFRFRFHIEKHSPILLALGLTALSYKAEGAKILMRAIKKLKDKYPNIVLILTREGTYSKELKRFAKDENLLDHVVFTGNLDNPFVPLSICDIYTHIILGEGGVSLALLEAMGKPIIATRIGGIPEAIEDGENGILVEPDADQISERIEYLLENKEIAEKLGRNAKRKAEEDFTWENSALKFMQIYFEEKSS